MRDLVPEAAELREDCVRVASEQQELTDRARRGAHELRAAAACERVPVSLGARRRAHHHVGCRVVWIRVLSAKKEVQVSFGPH